MTTLRRSLAVLTVALAAAAPPLALAVLPAACGSLGARGEPSSLSAMSDAEFAVFDRRLSSYLAVGVQGLVEEEVLEAGDLERVAELLEAISSSTVPPGATSVLEHAFELEGWKSAALGLLLLEADLMLERRAAWASPRASKLMETAAEAIRGGAATEEELESAAEFAIDLETALALAAR